MGFYEEKMAEINKLDNGSLSKIVEDATLRTNISLALINQITYQETEEGKLIPEPYKALSNASIFGLLRSLPHEIISLQTLRSEVDHIAYFDKAGDIKSIKTIVSEAAMLPTIMVQDAKIKVNAKAISELAMTMLSGAVEVIFADINKQSIKITASLPDKNPDKRLLEIIENASSVIKENVGVAANFVVLPHHMARMLKSYFTFEYDFDGLPNPIKRLGYLKNKWVAFIDSHKDNTLLVGYRGSHPTDAGVIFAPYVMFCNPIKNEKLKAYTFHSHIDQVIVQPNYFCSVEINDKSLSSILA